MKLRCTIISSYILISLFFMVGVITERFFTDLIHVNVNVNTKGSLHAMLLFKFTQARLINYPRW